MQNSYRCYLWQYAQRQKSRDSQILTGETHMALTNVGVLTEGFDDPGVSCIAMARPTKSEGLYAQCRTRCSTSSREGRLYHFGSVDLSDLSW